MRRKGHECIPHIFGPCLEMINRKVNAEEKKLMKLRLRLDAKKDKRKAQRLKEKEEAKKLRKYKQKRKSETNQIAWVIDKWHFT